MDTRSRTSLLTPAMAGLLERISRASQRPWTTLAPQQARQAYELSAEILDLPRAPLARVQELRIPARDGTPLRARLYAASPQRAPDGAHAALPALLYLHGGGFVVGSLETHDSLCRQLALRSGGAVLAVDYRLAPEHRFPTAVDDALSALRWLAAHAASLGLDPARLAVGGDSAGGTLATVCAIVARDEAVALRAQLLITPGTAPTAAGFASRRLFGHGFLLDHDTIEWFFDQYADAHQRHDWRFAPLLADELEGVAPAVVLLAECDPVVDEGLAYADRLRAAGVPVDLDLVRGVTHDFVKMGRALRVAGEAQQFLADSLRRHWSHGTTI